MPPCYYISWNGYYCHTPGLKTREMRTRMRGYNRTGEKWRIYQRTWSVISLLLRSWNFNGNLIGRWSRSPRAINPIVLSHRDINFMMDGFFEYFAVSRENSAVCRSFGSHAYRNLNSPVCELTLRSIADLRRKNHREYEEAAKHSRRRRMVAYAHFPRCKRRNG